MMNQPVCVDAILSNTICTHADFHYQKIQTSSRPVIMIMTLKYSLLQIVNIPPAHILKKATQIPTTESTLISTLNQPTTMNPTKTMPPSVRQTPPQSGQAALHYTLQSTKRMWRLSNCCCRTVQICISRTVMERRPCISRCRSVTMAKPIRS